MKKLMIVAAVAFSVALANADYLYWQVNPSESQGYDWVMLYVGNGGSYNILDRVGSVQNIENVGATDYYTVDVSGLSDKSFYIEYANYSGGQYTNQKRSESQTYSELANNYAIIGSSTLPTTMAQIWQGGSFYAAVPEPTSALLMLFGLSGLALKRRKA